MAAGMKSSGEGLHDINITPFVDVMLVLLIIFMISTPAMVYRGMTVALPHAAKSQDLSHVTLKLTVTAKGEVFLDRTRLKDGDLGAAVKKLREARVPVDALIAADAASSHGAVMKVAGDLQALGVDRVGFAVQK